MLKPIKSSNNNGVKHLKVNSNKTLKKKIENEKFVNLYTITRFFFAK